MIKTLTQAKEIVGGLSSPSKMPGRAYSLPAQRCITGQKLAKIPGTVCSHCYADNRGNYRFKNVKKALEKRYQLTMRAANAVSRFGAFAGGKFRAKFITAMVKLINHYSPEHFRWHDSGDLQSIAHLELITEVCRATPNTKHWLPTREYSIVKRWAVMGGVVPDNLVIRMSAHKLEQQLELRDAPRGIVASSVDSGEGYRCPALQQDNSCGDCRACWNPDTANIDYHRH